jgi:hypothetical protein
MNCPKCDADIVKPLRDWHALAHPAAAPLGREAIARIIEPTAWACKDHGFTHVGKDDRELSLVKADAILALAPAAGDTEPGKHGGVAVKPQHKILRSFRKSARHPTIGCAPHPFGEIFQ